MNGLIRALQGSAAILRDGEAGGTPGAGGAPAFALPKEFAGLEHFKGIDSVDKLAKGYHERATATSKPFADQLPEDIRTDAVFKDIKDLAGLAKGYHSAAKMVGLDKGSVVVLPNWTDAKASEEFYNRLGRPAKAEEYKIAKPKEGDWSEADKAFQAQVLPLLHGAGMTQRQLDAIAPKWNELVTAAVAGETTAKKAAQAQGLKALQTEWGVAGDQKLDDAYAALDHFVPKEERAAFDAMLETKRGEKGSFPGSDPVFIKFLSRLGAQLREDGVIGAGAGGGADGALSPTEAKQQINAKYVDKDFLAAYDHKEHKGHKDAVAEMARLHELAYPV